MLQHNTKNTIYFSNQPNEDHNENNEISEEKLEKIFQMLGKQVIKEKTLGLQDLERLLQSSIQQSTQNQGQENQEIDIHGTNEPITKYLQEQGYLREDKKWLTHKGFFEIGTRLLNDLMRTINKEDFGFHETNEIGNGNITQDTTKKFELGDDIRFLNIPQTILNSIQRLAKTNSELQFPVKIDHNDLEVFETREEVKVAIVYCIDLSSTMKYSVGSGEGSRIEAAKKALWSLYILNKKFFPNDSIYVIGFGSFANEIKPYDIPYLKTYDANDNFLHYTNYQAAFRLALKILKRDRSQNKRMVMITDGQPSACFIDTGDQKNNILADKPYSHFYTPDDAIISRLQNERQIKLNISDGKMVYLCYRYKQVDKFIELRTINEAKKCRREGIEIDTIMVSEEDDLLDYVKSLEMQLRGRAYYINPANIGKILISDFISNKKILHSKQSW